MSVVLTSCGGSTEEPVVVTEVVTSTAAAPMRGEPSSPQEPESEGDAESPAVSESLPDVGNSVVRMTFTNGGVVNCHASYQPGPVTMLTCGDASPELNFPDMEGSTIQSNAVFVDFSGGAPVITGHNSSNMGRVEPVPIEQGRYRFRDLTLVHDGERATFTTADGDSFWVGVDGFGTD